MEYVIIAALFILSCGLWIFNTIGSVRGKFPTLNPKMVFNTFFAEEWNSIGASALLLIFLEVCHFVLVYNHIVLSGISGQWWFQYVVAIIAGWGGPKIFYKALGSTVQALEKKAENLPGAMNQTTTTKTETPTAVTTVVETVKKEPKQD